MELIIDDRERAIIQLLPGSQIVENLAVRVERIEVGDYCIVHNRDPYICIERKTWKDLASSIKDGRTENMQKMRDLRDKTGCSLFYLIEGSPFHAPTRKFSNIEFRNLESYLDHIQLLDNVSVIYAKTAGDVLPRIATLAKNCARFAPEAKVDGGGQERLLKTRTAKTDHEKKVATWCAVPDVGRQTADVLVRAGMTIRSARAGGVTAEELAALVYPSGVEVGEARAKKIIGGVRRCTVLAILSAVHGISKTSAQKVVDSGVDIFAAAPDAIANISIGRRRLGAKLAAEIELSIS